MSRDACEPLSKHYARNVWPFAGEMIVDEIGRATREIPLALLEDPVGTTRSLTSKLLCTTGIRGFLQAELASPRGKIGTSKSLPRDDYVRHMCIPSNKRANFWDLIPLAWILHAKSVL